ncbi:MAG TPA: SOS response-associated peptidase [Mycobacteriales bacterium]|jgi:putative SOS response-associated peptidase YedK|nr:SOS response-associated peptidase [Mycobacteriales bacterium]
MCGRYASSRKPDDLVGYFEVQDPPEEVLPPSWNVAPTDPVYAVVQRETRQLRVLRWGLVPSWAKDPKVGARFINARRETVATTNAFRAAYAKRRCLLPADGYYEWKPEGTGKQPYFLTTTTGDPLAMAGLFEHWKRPDGTWLSTCTVLTTSAPDELGEIHDRTPLLVPKELWAVWLDPDVTDPDAVLVPGTPGVLDAWPVGKDVGNVRNNGPHLVDPV